MTGRIRISGIGLRETIHGKLDDGAVTIPNSDDKAGRMASYLMSSKAENTNKKYFGHFNRFKSFRESKRFSKKTSKSNTCGYLSDSFNRHEGIISCNFCSVL